jgi:hypothetical protein
MSLVPPIVGIHPPKSTKAAQRRAGEYKPSNRSRIDLQSEEAGEIVKSTKSTTQTIRSQTTPESTLATRIHKRQAKDASPSRRNISQIQIPIPRNPKVKIVQPSTTGLNASGKSETILEPKRSENKHSKVESRTSAQIFPSKIPKTLADLLLATKDFDPSHADINWKLAGEKLDKAMATNRALRGLESNSRLSNVNVGEDDIESDIDIEHEDEEESDEGDDDEDGDLDGFIVGDDVED